jgi:hypothetical protein
LPVLTPLLDRLRRARLPPGAAAGAIAVPSAGDELAAEVTFLFGDLEAIARRRQSLLTAARAGAVEAERAAAAQRGRLLAQAREVAEQRAAQVLVERRVRVRSRSSEMLVGAEREAAEILARGRKRTPAMVQEIARRLLEDSR